MHRFCDKIESEKMFLFFFLKKIFWKMKVSCSCCCCCFLLLLLLLLLISLSVSLLLPMVSSDNSFEIGSGLEEIGSKMSSVEKFRNRKRNKNQIKRFFDVLNENKFQRCDFFERFSLKICGWAEDTFIRRTWVRILIPRQPMKIRTETRKLENLPT